MENVQEVHKNVTKRLQRYDDQKLSTELAQKNSQLLENLSATKISIEQGTQAIHAKLRYAISVRKSATINRRLKRRVGRRHHPTPPDALTTLVVVLFWNIFLVQGFLRTQQIVSWTRLRSIGKETDTFDEVPHEGNPSRRSFLVGGASLGGLWASDAAAALDPSSAAASRTIDPTTLVPYSSVRRTKSLRLPNGVKVLLVQDANARQCTAALTIRGAGQFLNGDGLAHLMEHMVLSSTRQDFDTWITDRDGSSNGFTAYEKVCFHFACPDKQTFPEALERFASLFYESNVRRVCLKQEATLRREIRRVDSELVHTDDFLRELYLTKHVINQDHPYAQVSAGTLQSLETIPLQKGINVGHELWDFFQRYYQPSNAILVVVAPVPLTSLEGWMAPFSTCLSSQNYSSTTVSRPAFPSFLSQPRKISTFSLFRPISAKDGSEKMSFQWSFNFDYSGLKEPQSLSNTVTITQIGFVVAQILGRRGRGSLYSLLKKRNWVPDGITGLPRISLPADVSGFQILKLDLSLTPQGFASRSAVIAAVYDSINALQSISLSTSPYLLSRELIAQYATVAQLYGYTFAARPPDAIELAFDGQIYGLEAVQSGQWIRFPQPQDRNGISSIQQAMQGVLETMSNPFNTIIIATASKKTILYNQANALFDNILPKLSPASWDICPTTGARYYSENMFRLSGRVNEWLTARFLEDELSAPVINPLIPPALRPPRIQEPILQDGQPSFLLDDTISSRRQYSRIRPFLGYDNDATTRSSILKDYWAVLDVQPHAKTGLPMPRSPPEPSCRCVFVLQLLSSRPARANVRMAARAQLWKASLDYALSDLVRNHKARICGAESD